VALERRWRSGSRLPAPGVVIADIDEPAGAALAEQIGARFVRTDVRIEADNDDMVDTAVRELGRLDIVRLNAGVGYGGDAAGKKFDIERYRRVMAVNLDGATFGIRAAWRGARHSLWIAFALTSLLAIRAEQIACPRECSDGSSRANPSFPVVRLAPVRPQLRIESIGYGSGRRQRDE
jgi:NAD(P)-dependent dehydrogenase (short-subunit alcohol dehydrogenase family)